MSIQLSDINLNTWYQQTFVTGTVFTLFNEFTQIEPTKWYYEVSQLAVPAQECNVFLNKQGYYLNVVPDNFNTVDEATAAVLNEMITVSLTLQSLVYPPA